MKRREQEDMEYITKSDLPFEQYRNCVFLVTGATGLIGSLLVKNLLYCNQIHHLSLKVLAIVRDLKKGQKIYEEFLDDKSLEIIVCDLEIDVPQIDVKIDYIVHTAAVTQSKNMVTRPVETIRLSVYGTDKLLSLAVEKKAKCFLYLSSM